MEYQSPLDSREAFGAFASEARQALKAQIADRAAFLESARLQLGALQTLAREAANEPLIERIAALIDDASREIASLRDGTATVSAPRTAVVDETTSRESRGPAWRPWTSTRTGPSQPVPALPARQPEAIFADVDALQEQVGADTPDLRGVAGLIRLKALLCRQRGLQAELAVAGVEHWPLRQLLHQIRRRIDDTCGPGHYLIPLRAEVFPTEPWPWYRLAELYDGLARAQDALEWYQANTELIPLAQRQEVLECTAAHQTRLWRHLQGYFPRQNDEHQISLFRDLRAAAETEGVYLSTLQERCPDETLVERTEQLASILHRVREELDGIAN